MKSNEETFPVRYIVYGVIGMIALISLFFLVYTIPAGYKGVVLTFGKPSVIATGEGLNFKIPFVQSVVKMDTRTTKYEADLTAASSDLQDVNTKIAINYHLSPDSVSEIYRTIGINYAEKVIYPLEQESNKAATAQFTAEELITKREQVRNQMENILREKLSPKGIIVESISIVNFKFSDVFSNAIEQKVTATQLKLKAEQDLQRIKVEAEQTIAKATAEAESLRLQKQQISPELLQLRQIEVQSKALDVQRAAVDKWAGVLPQVTGNNIPFISIDLNPVTQKISEVK